MAARVERKQAFEDTVAILANISHADLIRPMRVQFQGEDASDLGGPAREWARLVRTGAE